MRCVPSTRVTSVNYFQLQYTKPRFARLYSRRIYMTLRIFESPIELVIFWSRYWCTISSTLIESDEIEYLPLATCRYKHIETANLYAFAYFSGWSHCVQGKHKIRFITPPWIRIQTFSSHIFAYFDFFLFFFFKSVYSKFRRFLMNCVFLINVSNKCRGGKIMNSLAFKWLSYTWKWMNIKKIKKISFKKYMPTNEIELYSR